MSAPLAPPTAAPARRPMRASPPGAAAKSPRRPWERADGSTVRGPGGRPPRALTDAAGDPPQGARMTREDFLSRRFENRAEWVDGRLDYLPMPRSLHARLAAKAFILLYEHLKGVKPDAILAGMSLRVWCGRRYREPDAALLLDPDDPREQPEEWLGADLVVEVVSPDDPDRDYSAKREDYAAAGVREYWIVDPRAPTPGDPRGRTVTVLILEDGAYRERVYREGETAAGELLPGFAPAVAACLNPNPAA